MGNDKTDKNKGPNADINLPLNPTPENENYEDRLPSIEGDCEGYIPPPENESVQQNIGALLLEKRLHDKKQEPEKELKPEDFLRQGYEQIQKARKQILYACTFIFCGVLLLLFYVTLAKGKIDKYTGDIDKLKKSMESLDKTIQDKIDISVKNMANKETPTTTEIAKFQAKPVSTVNKENVSSKSSNQDFNNSAFVLVTDSVTQFSGIQGKYGWTYGYYKNLYDNPQFIQFEKFNPQLSRWDIKDICIYISDNGMTPGGPQNISDDGKLKLVSRKWTSNISGDVIVSGIYGCDKEMNSSSDGVKILLVVDGKTLLVDYIFFGNGPKQYSIKSKIKEGSTIELIADPIKYNHWDLIIFNTQIYIDKR